MARTGNNARVSAFGIYGGAPTFAADLTEIADTAADLIGESVASVSALPASDNWVGRAVLVVADGITYQWLGKWVPVGRLRRRVAATASGSLSSGQTVQLFTDQTIPASPFGAGVPYTVIVKAYSAAASSSTGTLAISVLLDGVAAPVARISQQTNDNSDITVQTEAEADVDAPDTTHTVRVNLTANNAGLTVRANTPGKQDLSGAVIVLERLTSF